MYQQNFSKEDQRVNTLAFAGRTVSIVTTQLHYLNTKSAKISTNQHKIRQQTNQHHGCVTIKHYLIKSDTRFDLCNIVHQLLKLKE